MSWGGRRVRIINREEVAQFYINNPMPIEQIAAHFNISRSATYEIISLLPEYKPFKPHTFTEKKVCDICGIGGKIRRYKGQGKFLCDKHYRQMIIHGVIIS